MGLGRLFAASAECRLVRSDCSVLCCIRLSRRVVILLLQAGAPLGFGFSVALAKGVPHLQYCFDVFRHKAALLVKPLSPQLGDDGHESNTLVMASDDVSLIN